MPSQHIAVLLQFCGVTSIACIFAKEERRAPFESWKLCLHYILCLYYTFTFLYMCCNLLWINDKVRGGDMWHYVGSPPSIVRLFLFSHSLDCISSSYEEMCDDPIGTTRWSPAKKWNGLKFLMYHGAEGVSSHAIIISTDVLYNSVARHSKTHYSYVEYLYL